MGAGASWMKALVTGGGGFLGSAIVGALIDRAIEVHIFARGDYPAIRDLGVETSQGDLADAEAVSLAVEGCDLVFHVGAKAGSWGSYESYYQTNVIGTQNVIEACREHQVPKLIYTSSPSVSFAGVDQEGEDESAPLPERYLGHYSKTKAQAEALVLEANDASLSTVALRPHLIWGPGDTQLIPRIIEQAKSGRLRFVGDGTNLIDAVYIDNAVHAHLLAMECLGPQATCAGKAYYITNDEPWPSGKVINGILHAADLSPITKTIAPGIAYVAGMIFECLYTILHKEDEPRMTRFVARQLATAHWFDIAAAKNDLGYTADVSMDEGMRRLAESFK